jgi:hypothetical protein
MAEIRDLSVTDASNTARFPENQNPSTVNDGARALEGMLARALEDTIDGILVTGGTGSAYTLSPNRSWTASATMDNGTEFSVRWHAASGNAPTLNVDTTDARQLRWPNGETLSASDILADTQARVKYNTSLSAWVVMDAPVPQKANFGHVINSKSLTTTITGSAFIPIVSKATGETHRMLRATVGLTPAVQADQETATSTAVAVVPGVQQFHPSAAKCWGYVTVSAGTPTLAVNYNVTSIADTDVGRVTVTIATDFSSANYAVVALTSGATTAGRNALEQIGSRAAGAFEIVNTNEAATASDPDAYSFAAYGDQ